MKDLIKNKSSLYLVLGFLIFCMLCGPALAGRYDYDGFPLETIEKGTVKGDVYVCCGDRAGLSGTSYANNTYITNFTNVPTNGIKWAMLKVGVYGANTSRSGWMNASLNDNLLDADNNPDKHLNVTPPSNIIPVNIVNASGTGLYLVDFDVTDVLENLNNPTIQASVKTWPDLTWGNNYRLDGRVYGAVLIVVYENNSMPYTQYWINEGNMNLHKNANVWINGSSVPVQDLDANITQFNGAVNNTSGIPSLTVGYFAGDANQNDYLYFNAPKEPDDSPYNLFNPGWNLDPSAYGDFLVGTNVASGSNGTNFDLKTFDNEGALVANLLEENNYAIFWRGHDSVNETIWDPAYPGVNSETESYLSPFLAVLKIKG